MISAEMKRRGYHDPETCTHANVSFLGGSVRCTDCCIYGQFNHGTDHHTRPYIWPKEGS